MNEAAYMRRNYRNVGTAAVVSPLCHSLRRGGAGIRRISRRMQPHAAAAGIIQACVHIYDDANCEAARW